MRIVQRLIATISYALFLQLSLLGSQAPCSMVGGAAPTRMAGSHSMNGSHADQACDTRSSNESCRGPCVPATPGACASMTSCAATTAILPDQPRALGSVAQIADLPEPLSSESVLAAAPEIPPPRV